MPAFARGTDQSKEYQRSDESFYKGIVVKNWDPHKLLRVKIYVPEISNQPLDQWLSQYKLINTRFPGKNNEEDNWGEDKEKKDTSNMNNTKYIPSAGTNYMLNNYVMSNDKITFPHIISKTKYETTCNKPQVFKYTNVEYKKNFYDNKSNKIDTLNWYFRPIITGQKNMYDMYKLETDIDKYSMNDPLNDVYMDPKSIKNEIATFPPVKQPIKNTLFKDGK